MHGNARILIIEDDNGVRAMLRELLEFAGYEVVEAADGTQGLHLFRLDPTDLIITDLLMPRKNGLETILEVRRDFPEAKIIAISGGSWDGHQDILATAQKCGAARTFHKPFKAKEMLEAIREVLPPKTHVDTPREAKRFQFSSLPGATPV
jgi:DNA-binding response OmpR family regulator